MFGTLGAGGSGGYSLSISTPYVITGQTGAVATLKSRLKGTVSYSILAGSTAGVTVNSATGAVSISSSLAAGAVATVKARAASDNGDAVERTFTLTGVNTLNALTIPSTGQVGVAVAISGATVGSVLTSPNLPAGMTLDSASRSITGSVPGSFVGFDIDETLPGSPNSPRRTHFAGLVLAYQTLGPLTATFSTTASAGTIIGAFTGLAPGETIVSVSPNDGRITIATAGTRFAVGLTASSAGTVNYTFTTSLGRPLTIAITAALGAGTASPFVTQPTISGTAAAGATLTAVAGTYQANWSHYGWVWSRGAGVGAPIGSAGTYTLSAALGLDDNQPIRLTELVQHTSGTIAAATTASVKFDTTPIYSVDFSAYPDGTKIPDKYTTAYSNGQATAFSASQGGLPGWFLSGSIASTSMADQTVVGGAQQTAGASGNIALLFDAGRTSYELEITTTARINLTMGWQAAATGAVNLDRSWDIGSGTGKVLSNWSSGSFTVANSFWDGATKLKFVMDAVNLLIKVYVGGVLVGTKSIASVTNPNGYVGLFGIPTTRSGLKSVKLSKIVADVGFVVTSSTLVEVGDGTQRVRLQGTYSGVTPTGFNFVCRDPSGATVIPSEAVTVNSISGGNFDVTTVTAFPASVQGRRPTIVLTKSNDATSTVAYNGVVPAYRTYKKRFGINVGPHRWWYREYATMKDWCDRGQWSITGGTYNGKNTNDDWEALYAAGVVDNRARLLMWPAGATGVSFAPNVWAPHSSEIGSRTFVLPPGQDFTVSQPGGGTMSVGVTKNLVTGQHTFNFTGTSSEFALTGFAVNLTQASFVAQGSTAVSFRLSADTSGQIWTDEIIAQLSHFQVLRVMDLLDTNAGGRWMNYASRRRFGYSTPEAIAELCNRTGAIPWICSGYNCPATETAQFVARLEALLDPSIPEIKADWLNEFWNFQGIYQAIAVKAFANGRYLNSGYGPSRGSATKFYPTYVNPGATLPDNVLAGEDVVMFMGGIGYAWWRANVNVSAGAVMPTVGSSPVNGTSDSNFTYMGEAGAAVTKEAGAFLYDTTVAAKAVSPRLKVAVNAMQGDYLRPASQQLTFAKTSGGTDTFASVCDAWAVAPYVQIFPTTTPTWASATAGSARVAALSSFWRTTAGTQTASISDAKTRWQAVIDGLALDKPADVWCYEAGPDIVVGQPTLAAALATDVQDWYLGNSGSTLQADVASFIDDNFAKGASTSCMFTFQPIYPFTPWNKATPQNYSTFGNMLTVTDTTSAIIAAELNRADYYKALP